MFLLEKVLFTFWVYFPIAFLFNLYFCLFLLRLIFIILLLFHIFYSFFMFHQAITLFLLIADLIVIYYLLVFKFSFLQYHFCLWSFESFLICNFSYFWAFFLQHFNHRWWNLIRIGIKVTCQILGILCIFNFLGSVKNRLRETVWIWIVIICFFFFVF